MALALDPEATGAPIGEAQPSPAGPADPEHLAQLHAPPTVPLPRPVQVLRFNQRQIEFVFRAQREFGDVFRMRSSVSSDPVVTSHPDHVKSLFTAKPDHAPSLTGESPLRPVVGSTSVLTAVGERHMRQRKLLLPHFHGEAIAQYSHMITRAVDREIDRWPTGRPIALAPRMQAITLDVIMGGIFGVDDRPKPSTPEFWLRHATRSILRASTLPIAQLGELMNIGRDEPVGLQRIGLEILDRPTYAVIRSRRRAADVGDRHDILSLLIEARTEDGEALTDSELRDELLTLVLAGHETTANQLAWTWERLVRTPSAHERLVEVVRGDADDAPDVIEATILESMRSRPVIPMIGRRVMVPWRLGDYVVPADTPVTMSILLLHHREDLYPEPFAFRPERWQHRKPSTYDWIPFGGGIRRCLGAALAMVEQRIVLRDMVQRLDIEAVEREPEHAKHRNVTMIPSKGAQVVIRAKRG
jgi:cytochrome P450